MMKLALLLTGIVSLATAENPARATGSLDPAAPGSQPDEPHKACPTTLTVTAPVDLSGCTTTIYDFTKTKSIDCGQCDYLTTSTYYPPYVGLGPECVGGVKTKQHKGFSTVTSCLLPSTTPAPIAPLSKRAGEVPGNSAPPPNSCPANHKGPCPP